MTAPPPARLPRWPNPPGITPIPLGEHLERRPRRPWDPPGDEKAAVTSPPQGRDSGNPALAALAVRVDGLRRRIETLAAQIETLTSTQHEHATMLGGITELRGPGRADP